MTKKISTIFNKVPRKKKHEESLKHEQRQRQGGVFFTQTRLVDACDSFTSMWGKKQE